MCSNCRPYARGNPAPSARSSTTTRGHVLRMIAILAAATSSAGPVARSAPPEPTYQLKLVDRAVSQDQSSWLIDYRFRHEGPAGQVVTPPEMRVRVEGWVSNSRVATHAVPRLSVVELVGKNGFTTTSDVIASTDEARRCRERLTLKSWTYPVPKRRRDPLIASNEPVIDRAQARGEIKLISLAVPPREVAFMPPEIAPDIEAATLDAGAVNETASARGETSILSLAPDSIVHVQLRLEHLHVLHGEYDPLLGTRRVEIKLGEAAFRDVVPLDREIYVSKPIAAWPAAPEDRLDRRVFFSPPDSLHLEAHVPGNQYYRFPERPVRYSSKMRLRFWYLIAPGGEGECRVKLAQYKDTPTAWKVLTDGAIEQTLTVVDRWTKVERVFLAEPDATTLALDFRVCGDIGEMWVDDVVLEPFNSTPNAGP